MTVDPVHLIIPCAGLGSRCSQSIAKQYLPILQASVLYYTLLPFIQLDFIATISIIVNSHDTHIEQYSTLSDKIKIARLGGSSRAATVANGLSYLATIVDLSPESWIMVHDAARCCITKLLITNLVNQLSKDAVGGILAIKVTDTLKSVISLNNDATELNSHSLQISHTLDRVNLYYAQTPQMFRYAYLRSAMDNRLNLVNITDEASAIEALGYHPRIIRGNNSNIKITYPNDIRIAESILSSNGMNCVG